MPTPTFGSIPLFVEGVPASGAGFELTRPSKRTQNVDIDQWSVGVNEGQSVVVARGPSANSYEESLESGLHYAQQGLDLIAIKSPNALAIKSVEDERLIWWNDSSGTTVRITSLAPLTLDAGEITVTVTDAAGNVRPSNPPPNLQWHESFRYFRLSQTTEDLFDAFRNCYLALESVLSSIAPQQMKTTGRPSEGEGVWFKRALTVASTIVDMKPLTANQPDPVSFIYQSLYIDTRSAMSHAKSGRPVLLPQTHADRETVLNNLKLLRALYLKLAEAHLNARRAGSLFFKPVFDSFFNSVFDGLAICVSDDDSPFSQDDSAPNPRGGRVIDVGTAGVVDLSMPFVGTKTWTIDTSELATLRAVRRLVCTHAGAPAMAEVLPADLLLEGVDRLEVEMGGRGISGGQPRDRYPY